MFSRGTSQKLVLATRQTSSIDVCIQLYASIFYLPTGHLHNMHSEVVPVVAWTKLKNLGRVLVLLVLVIAYDCHQIDPLAVERFEQLAFAIRVSFSSDYSHLRVQSGSSRICTNKWGNYSSSTHNGTDTEQAIWSTNEGKRTKHNVNDQKHKRNVIKVTTPMSLVPSANPH